MIGCIILQSRAEQSRAEQSRAEQSRAEQSRAEQSRAEQSRAEQSSFWRKIRQLKKLCLYAFSVPKSLYFCCHYFPLKVAATLPVLVCFRTRISEMHGEVILPEHAKTGTVRIGFGGVGIFDEKRSRTMWQVNGTVVFKGRAAIGHGSRISVNRGATLEFGDHFCITAESHIVSSKGIRFGDDVLMSWQCLVMDTDFHKIWSGGTRVNENKEIVIGNHVWIGCRNTILKGVHIGDGCVIGAGSNVVKSIDATNAVVGGNPAHVLKQDIRWSEK